MSIEVIGLDHIYPVSATHGLGLGYLLEAIVAHLPPVQELPGTALGIRVAVLGRPNVGKSSFIARVSAARPKIADYPFTTLTPNLGVVYYKNYRSFVVADIPGLIEGAHQGAGLGHRFLKHVERTDLLLHFIDLSHGPERDPIREYEALNRELVLFNEEMANKRQIVVVNKIDLPDVKDRLPEILPYFTSRDIRVFPISAVTGEGVETLIDEIAGKLWR